MLALTFLRRFAVAAALGLPAGLAGLTSAAASGIAKYELQADAPPALQDDVLEADPDAAILRPDQYLRRGDTFLVPGGIKGSPKEAWVQLLTDWVEPLTTVAGTLPEVAADEMLLAETFGYVSIEKPGVKGKYGKPITANLGDVIPAGSQLASKEGASAAVLIGGQVSVRLGENTTAQLEHRVVGTGSSQVRTTRVNLEKGYVFCKIGRASGETLFSVRTEVGQVVAEGTDFVVYLQDERLVVGVAKGSVVLKDAAGKEVANATSNKLTSLRVVHLPRIENVMDRINADSRFLSQLLEFIPQINLKLKALRGKLQQGDQLTENEDRYLRQIPKITYLRRVQAAE
ncbi:MAG: FecR family protein [Verrucomicrobiota bacterium]